MCTNTFCFPTTAYREDCPTIIAVEDNKSGGRDQLSFQKNDVMYLILSEGERCFVVHKDIGMKGYVPRSSVTELLSEKRYLTRFMYSLITSYIHIKHFVVSVKVEWLTPCHSRTEFFSSNNVESELMYVFNV